MPANPLKNFRRLGPLIARRSSLVRATRPPSRKKAQIFPVFFCFLLPSFAGGGFSSRARRSSP
jgi:hypothetical protein